MEKYFYDAWGVPKIIEDSTNCGIAEINPFRYRGYYYDEEIKLYHLQSRYYDPQVGRFINSDVMLDTATVLGFNLFAYCGNNPIIYVDPTGYGRIYVIYYNNPGSGFYDQAMNSLYYNRKSNNVYMISVTSNQDFIDAWNSMSGTIDYVYLYLHRGKGVLYFKGESLGFSGK